MKISKRKVLVVALAICIIAVLSMGTLAWFSDNDTVTNKFMVTNSNEDDPDDIFSVDVYEYVGDDGEPSHFEEDGYVFDELLPGDVLTKQPFVQNTGAYDQFIRVTVTVSDYAKLTSVLGDAALIKTSLLGNLNLTDLTLDKTVVDANADTIAYVFYVNEIVEPGDSVEVFEKVLIPTKLTQADFINTSLSDGFTVDIFAEAIQTENLGDSGEAKATFEYYERFNAMMP